MKKILKKSVILNVLKILNEQNEPETADLVTDNVNEFLNTLKNFNGKIIQEKVGGYKFQKIVETFQISLEILGYSLPRYGVDGLFGPETTSALNKFKQDNGIEFNPNDKGLFDEQTSTKMYELLKTKNLKSEDIERFLSKTTNLQDYQEELQKNGIEKLNDSQYMKLFFDETFKKLGITPTDEKLKFFMAWRQAEGGKAANNPFNTTKTMREEGITNYNSVGVKNYPTIDVGILATVNTLKLKYYQDLMNKLNNNMVTAEELANSPDLKTWGTGSLVKRVLKSGNINPPPIKRS
jgi:hypothetical protein